MPEWPKSSEQLTEAGYRYTHASNCKGCGKRMVWVKTPKGKSMPLVCVPMVLVNIEQNFWQPHFIDCPQAKQFKKPAVGGKRTKAGISGS
jgi:hypothetical protein